MRYDQELDHAQAKHYRRNWFRLRVCQRRACRIYFNLYNRDLFVLSLVATALTESNKLEVTQVAFARWLPLLCQDILWHRGNFDY